MKGEGEDGTYGDVVCGGPVEEGREVRVQRDVGEEGVDAGGQGRRDAGEHLRKDVAEGGAPVQAVGVELLAARFAEAEVVGLRRGGLKR